MENLKQGAFFQLLFFIIPQELESVHEDVQAMSACCEEMTNRLKVCFYHLSLLVDNYSCMYRLMVYQIKKSEKFRQETPRAGGGAG